MPDPIVFLTDNGSLRPQATEGLRRLSSALGSRIGLEVEAVSLLHSHKIPAESLGGRPATIVKRRLRECFRHGRHDFVVLPLFLGPSLAITDYLPEVVAELREKECPQLRVRIASPLAGKAVTAPDPRLAAILESRLLAGGPLAESDTVALVDHGTPIRVVNELRNVVAAQLGDRLGRPVQPCSMERREGPDYAFNEPLLEQLGEVLGAPGGHLRLAMFFLLPGRHAGDGGDVATIVDGLVGDRSFDRVTMSPLMAEDPLLLDILADRFAEVVNLQK